MRDHCVCCLTPIRDVHLGAICQVCNWEEDALDGRHQYSTANHTTLKRARREWLATLTREERAIFAFRLLLDDTPDDEKEFFGAVKQVEDEVVLVARRREKTWKGFPIQARRVRTKAPTRFEREMP